MYPDLTIKPRSVSALCWQIHPLLAVQVPPLRVWVHCPRASNGLLPRRSNLVGYVRWDERSDQSSFQTIDSNSFTRSQPGGILGRHTKDQLPHLLAHCPTATDRLGSRDPFPVQAKASAMPLHHGSWRDQNKGPFPPRPKLSQKNPKQLVHCR